MSSRDAVDVVVLGGGISGLTCAFRLQEAGHTVVVLEARDEPGGAIRTWREDGFLFELGPNTVLDNTPEIGALLEDSGLTASRIGATATSKRRFVVKGGRLVALPAGPVGFLKTPLFSWRAKLRLLREPFIRRAPEDVEESIADFTRRRLGPEFLEYAVGPFVSGVYAGDPERLSVQHATAKIHALEVKHGSLIRGAIAKRKGPAPSGGLFSFQRGLDTLPQGLAAALGDGWQPGTRAVSIEHGGDGFVVTASSEIGGEQTIRARSVVSTLPAKAAARLLESLDHALGSSLDEIPHADVAVVGLGFERSAIGHALDGFGFLAPRAEDRFVLGCLFPSTLFPERAPDGHVALSAFVGGALHPERVAAEPDEILERTLADLRPLLAISGDPVIHRVERWRPAIPQYVVGHGAHKQAAAAFEESCPGVFLSGNCLWGVSVADCIRNATGLARRVSSHLGKAAAIG